MSKNPFDLEEAVAYEQIGRFLVAFEKTCSWLRFGIRCALLDNGLNTPSLASILLENRFMTASNIVYVHEAIMTELKIGENADAKAIIDQLHTDFRCLMEDRNRVVHGNWYIAYIGRGPEDLLISGRRGNPSKSAGMQFERVPNSMKELTALTKRAEDLSELSFQALKYTCAHHPLEYLLAKQPTQ